MKVKNMKIAKSRSLLFKCNSSKFILTFSMTISGKNSQTPINGVQIKVLQHFSVEPEFEIFGYENTK